ncbi:aldehyde dehydrogenase family protein [bacterium]|nr:aldehyde dehydrogenase family protein [bacterium]
MELLKVGPLIDGREVFEPGAEVREVLNPATGEVIAIQSCADEACAGRAVESSRAAFESAAWRGLSAAERGNRLIKLAEVVERNAAELIELELIDTGKPLKQLREAELPLTLALIRFYAGAADKIEGRVKSTDSGSFLLSLYEPYGVVAGILPWNYPLVNAAMKLAPALAAGNTIVLKPSVETPLSTLGLARLCAEAGIPPGVVNVVTGPGGTTGNALVRHRLVRKISFTGSTAAGRTIQKLAAESMKTVNLELGGKNAIIVFADADLERAAEAAVFSAFVNSGQLCVACSRLLVEQSVAERFEEILLSKTARVRLGDPRELSTLAGPMITRSQYDTVREYVRSAPAEGCRVVAGGGKPSLPATLERGFWVEPTIISDVRPGTRLSGEEIFGPVLTVQRFRDEAEAVALSNSVEYGLSGSVWTRDSARALRLVKALDTGIIWVNSMLNGYPQIPVPPHKLSGTGVELGIEGLMAYCQRKSAVVAYDDQAVPGWGLR